MNCKARPQKPICIQPDWPFPFVPFLPGRQLKMSSPAKVELAVLLKSRAKEALRSRGQRSLPDFFLDATLGTSFFARRFPKWWKLGGWGMEICWNMVLFNFYSFFVQRSLKPTVESMCTLLCRARPQSRQERRPKLAASRSYQKIHLSPRREVDALLMLSLHLNLFHESCST